MEDCGSFTSTNASPVVSQQMEVPFALVIHLLTQSVEPMRSTVILPTSPTHPIL